tara:strand:- start:35 stop:379 length:345 start_codon:yes stop_codon:yes gene_type:complete
MAIAGRYQSRLYFYNTDPLYAHYFRDRGVPYISMFTTPILSYPSKDQVSNLTIERVVWAVGSSYQKLASQYYGDATLWWVIGWFNKKPAEFMMKAGDIVHIPLPIDKILGYYRV